MRPQEAVAFVKRHGVVLQAARGPVPSLAEAIAGGPIRGSWWAHPKGKEIFHAAEAVCESPDVLVCKLMDGKITYVHRRLWPALVKLAGRFRKEQLAKVWDEHTSLAPDKVRAGNGPRWLCRGPRRSTGGVRTSAPLRSDVMSRLVAVLLLAPPAPRAEQQLHVGVVAVAAEPNAAKLAGALANSLAARLAAAGFRVTRVGVDGFLPTEEAVAQVTLSQVEFVIGVGSTTACPVLLLPPNVAEPEQRTGHAGLPELRVLIKDAVAAARYRHSAVAAAGLKGTMRWCQRRPNELESYVLSTVQSPALVMRLSAEHVGLVAGALPSALNAASKAGATE